MGHKDEHALLRTILPYTYIVGQQKLKLALELAYIAPRIGGVLVSGKRGTAKSTTVRAFSTMMYQALPVTIPINATEDRVVGGWEVTKLAQGQPSKKKGLLEEANGKLLYIDEVNLLDDHIINIILDVTSTGKLVIQREGLGEDHDVRVILVGTINPEEGGLRPQLLDRFGFMVGMEEETEPQSRLQILETVLAFDRALQTAEDTAFLLEGYQATEHLRAEIERAKERFYAVKLGADVAEACVHLAKEFHVEGHRSNYLLALACCAYAARQDAPAATLEHLREVAELVLRHRLPGAQQLTYAQWGEKEKQHMADLLEHV